MMEVSSYFFSRSRFCLVEFESLHLPERHLIAIIRKCNVVLVSSPQIVVRSDFLHLKVFWAGRREAGKLEKILERGRENRKKSW